MQTDIPQVAERQKLCEYELHWLRLVDKSYVLYIQYYHYYVTIDCFYKQMYDYNTAKLRLPCVSFGDII